MKVTWMGIVVCWLAGASGAAGAERPADWPHVRGPDYDGHADGTNVAWPWAGGQPALLWRTRIGEGYSGMSVADGRVYTQAQGRDGQYVVCLDVATGRLLWQTRYNYPWQLAADYPGPYATPTYSGERVYFADCYGFAGCVDARNGKSLWKVSLTERFGGQGTGFGYACSPLVEEGRVFLPVGGKGAAVVAISAGNGALLWQAGDGAASYVPSLPITVQGHRQIVTFLQNALVANDPATGKELWRAPSSDDGYYDEHSCFPLYQEPLLVCASPFRRGARVLSLAYEGATPKAEPVWTNKALSTDVFSAVLVDGCIYGSNVRQAQANPRGGTRSEFKCLELATGRQLWASAAPGHASVLACGDKLLLLNESGFLIVVATNRDGYSELARTRVIEGAKPCWTPPTVYEGRLLVRNQQTLACYKIGAFPPGTVSTAANLSGTVVIRRTGRAGLLGPFVAWLDRHENSARVDSPLSELALWLRVRFGSARGFGSIGLALAASNEPDGDLSGGQHRAGHCRLAPDVVAGRPFAVHLAGGLSFHVPGLAGRGPSKQFRKPPRIEVLAAALHRLLCGLLLCVPATFHSHWHWISVRVCARAAGCRHAEADHAEACRQHPDSGLMPAVVFDLLLGVGPPDPVEDAEVAAEVPATVMICGAYRRTHRREKRRDAAFLKAQAIGVNLQLESGSLFSKNRIAVARVPGDKIRTC